MKKIFRPGYGLLAADESVPTIGKKFVPLGVENNEENRRAYREMLLTTPEFENGISGVIFFDEQTKQATEKGQNFVDLVISRNAVAGIKVDKGVQILPGTNEETWTAGLDDLAKRCAEYY